MYQSIYDSGQLIPHLGHVARTPLYFGSQYGLISVLQIGHSVFL